MKSSFLPMALAVVALTLVAYADECSDTYISWDPWVGEWELGCPPNSCNSGQGTCKKFGWSDVPNHQVHVCACNSTFQTNDWPTMEGSECFPYLSVWSLGGGSFTVTPTCSRGGCAAQEVCADDWVEDPVLSMTCDCEVP